MNQLRILSFLLLIYFCSGISDLNIEESLTISSLDRDIRDGYIIKKLNATLTLSCSLKRNKEIVPVDHSRLLWKYPQDHTKRPTSSWIADGISWLTIRQLSVKDSGIYTCLDTENHTLTTQIAVSVKTQALTHPYCSPSTMFICDLNEVVQPYTSGGVSESIGTKCILITHLCDGYPDCPNGMDESHDTCQTDYPCHNKLMCRDGRCIPKQWCCIDDNNRYIHNSYSCVPHSCCHEYFPPLLDKTGGGWRKKPGGPPLLQTTLYTISACLLIFLIAVTLLISAICKARLKRSANYSARLQTVNDEQNQDPTNTPQSSNNCRYTLVPSNEITSPPYSNMYHTNLESPRSMAPVYSENVIGTTNIHDDAELPSYFEIQNELRNNGTNNVQVARPTDFGMSTLANAIFNARYRPVPQEIVSFGDISDSDSSSRSPGSHTFNIYASPNRRSDLRNTRISSPIQRLGESPESYLARRSAEQRRLRRANALDRILDRFGLNAPYTVERENNQTRSPTNANTIQPSNETANLNGRRQFVSSILGRLRNGFNRNVRTAETNSPPNGDSNNNPQQERRRPDTPNVLELSLDEIDLCRNGNSDTYTLNGRTIHLLGASFDDRPDLYNLGLQGLYIVDGIVENLNRFVGRPISPPPYSEVANVAPPKISGPPPPYVSRENLLALLQSQGGPSTSAVPTVTDVSQDPVGDSADTNVASTSNCRNSENIAPHANAEQVSSDIDTPSICENSIENITQSQNSCTNQDFNTSDREITMDIVNCRDDSIPLTNLNVESDTFKDIFNGNGEMYNVPTDSSVPSLSSIANHISPMSSNYSFNPNIKCASATENQQNNNFDITSPSCSHTAGTSLKQCNLPDTRVRNETMVGRSDTMNDISNNNVSFTNNDTSRQLSLSALPCESGDNISIFREQNNNPSTQDTSLSLRSDVGVEKPIVKRSIFPPLSLEFIDSDCVTD